VSRRVVLSLGGAACVVGGVWLAQGRIDTEAPVASVTPQASASAQTTEAPPPSDDDRAHEFRTPSGDPSGLTCEEARAIVGQARHNLAYAPPSVDVVAFAGSASDWLDPHGLWSVAPDAPIAHAIDRLAPALIASIEGRRAPDCAAAREIGALLVTWMGELRTAYERARTAGTVDELHFAAADPPFETTKVDRPARDLAALLGQRVRAVEQGLGPDAARFATTATTRYFPPLDAVGWSHVVLAAAVRAYISILDPHGAWAPLDEAASVYEVDLEAHPPSRLWEKASRTAIGVRVDSGAASPLQDGDVVLSIAGVVTAGMPLEQLEQLEYAASDAQVAQEGVVLRVGESELRTVTFSQDEAPGVANPEVAADDADDGLPVERIAYGSGDVLVVAIHDVRDDLGDALTRALLRERERAGRSIAGLVIDLRGNGGGSTDGAIDALGLFLPGAPLFPMKRRDGTIETDRAPEPPDVDRWTGAVATLVDGDTASAAEMISGALAAYRRAPSVGSLTFGKGCAQEYVDDDAREGVLRLTTLLYALPDGAPVQRIGLTPTISLPLVASHRSLAQEREATLPHAPPSWRGPDVRDTLMVDRDQESTWLAAWPPHGGSVGPCKDADVCKALRALGGSTPPRRVAKGP
jgi:carboxyl-terminal processing protease